ncbi:hypothetical protein ACT7DP_07290 [Bacillus paranthracis]
MKKADKDNIKRIPSVSITIYNKSLVEEVMQKFEEGIKHMLFFRYKL